VWLSPRNKDSFSEICAWSFDDVIAANSLLDEIERAEDSHRVAETQRARAEAEARRAEAAARRT